MVENGKRDENCMWPSLGAPQNHIHLREEVPLASHNPYLLMGPHALSPCHAIPNMDASQLVNTQIILTLFKLSVIIFIFLLILQIYIFIFLSFLK